MTKNTELAKVAQSSQTSKTIIKVLSNRERFSRKTDLSKLKREIKEAAGNLNQTEFLNFFKKLETLGYGSIIQGRGTNPSRFLWSYSIPDIIKASGVPLKEIKPEIKVLTPKLPVDGIEGVIQTPDKLVSFSVSEQNKSLFLQLVDLMGEIKK